MAFTDAIDVDAGDAILASTVDNLADNTEFNRSWLDAQHDAAISGADGIHMGEFDDSFFIKNTAEDAWGAIWLDNVDTANILFRMKTGTTKVNATPSSETDGVVIGAGGFV